MDRIFMRVMLGILVLAIIFDSFATMYGLQNNYLKEANPLAVKLINYSTVAGCIMSGGFRVALVMFIATCLPKVVHRCVFDYGIITLSFVHVMLVGWHVGLWTYWLCIQSTIS